MHPTVLAYGSLGVAIACELLGTTFLQKSEQFSKLAPTLTMAVFYAVSFYFLSQSLKIIPLGLAYAIWSGVGIVLTAVIGFFVFRQALDAAALVGIGLIVSGTIVVNVFSRTMPH